jgi:chromosome segregation ATPase
MLRSKLAERETKLQERETKIDKLTSKVDSLGDKISDLEDNLSAEKRRADKATDDYTRVKRELDSFEEKSSTNAQRLKDLQLQADDTHQKLRNVTQDHEQVSRFSFTQTYPQSLKRS